jgi:hypothetical protein
MWVYVCVFMGMYTYSPTFQHFFVQSKYYPQVAPFVTDASATSEDSRLIVVYDKGTFIAVTLLSLCKYIVVTLLLIYYDTLVTLLLH